MHKLRVVKDAEAGRLREIRTGRVPWRMFGPYLSERQWGTVREDYSESGNSWDYFSHDQARSRAYRWGEDGLAGISDDRQILCFALALWNGADPIMKERAFGLTNGEGNHGEDVKEYYYYLDSTPTHSYMRYLYKYPQNAYPYDDMVKTNRGRGRTQPEYELLDTGIFDEDRYFDVFVEYAKESPEELLVSISASNRGPDAASLHLLPTLWFRNTWTGNGAARPSLAQLTGHSDASVVEAMHEQLGAFYLYCAGSPQLLFTENDTNNERIFRSPNESPYVKDAFHEYVVSGKSDRVNPALKGTKCAAHYTLRIPAGGRETIALRLTRRSPAELHKAESVELFGPRFETVLETRKAEADEFYAQILPEAMGDDERLIARQALAGMLWSKQFYYFDVESWLNAHGDSPEQIKRRGVRNQHWHHMYNFDIISMPDKWEYPWYAAWDLAFHIIALGMVDLDFAKHQLGLLLDNRYIHPNGQIPAYEWNFNDVNPPVHAWSALFTYNLERLQTGQADTKWLRRTFDRLLMNFTWWVNRKDRDGHNVFEGGFLGLDNISVFDRSAPLPTGGWLEQADGTAWMALYSQNMFNIAIELAREDPSCEEMVLKFAQHFLWIASAMFSMGGETEGMWDETDGFFYDVLRQPDGRASRLKVRSIVGLLPLCAISVFEPENIAHLSGDIVDKYRRFIAARPNLVRHIHHPATPGYRNRQMLSIVDDKRLRRILSIMLDEHEFLSPFGLRSLSRRHAAHPFVLTVAGREHRVNYLPAESDSGLFGGNSNWRGPIWMPVNLLVIRALLVAYHYYGDNFKVECPSHSGNYVTLYGVAREVSRRLASIFLIDEQGRRPVFGNSTKFAESCWRDNILFHEYFDGDNGRGIGASHQTGWTGVIARLLHFFSVTDAKSFLESGLGAAFGGADIKPAA